MASPTCDDLTRFIYRFDFKNGWKNFRDGAPQQSSVERGRRKINSKYHKIYLSKKPKARRRKNAAYDQVNSLSLCCCEDGCLLKYGIFTVRQVIREERGKVFAKTYNEQNYMFSKLMEIKLCPSGRRTIKYKIPSLGQVCKNAFLKCYGISRQKISVLLQKIDPNGVSVLADQRGKHENNPRKLLPQARQQVIDYITSHHASESHYRRSRTKKKYFASTITMRKMWLEFTRRNPNFRTHRLNLRNKGPVISYSTFRNIFYCDLRESLSFRKPREDTCQTCDANQKKIDRASGRELQKLLIESERHLREGETRFASFKYDNEVLAIKRRRTTQ